jgi:hypothetical protein
MVRKKSPGLKPLDSISLIQGDESPCSLRRQEQKQGPIRRFWLLQNDDAGEGDDDAYGARQNDDAYGAAPE